MSLTAITPETIYDHLSSAELSGYKWEDTLVQAVIVQQCDLVAGYVHGGGGNPRIKLGCSVVPEECVASAIALVRFSLLSKLPGDTPAKTTLGPLRQAQYNDALRFLESVADGRISVNYDAEEGLTEDDTSISYGGDNINDWMAL